MWRRTSFHRPKMKPIAITVLVTGLALGCGNNHKHDGHHHHGDDGHHHDDEGHAHEAPNGGKMVELGEDACHLEFLLDESNATRMTILAHEFHPQKTYVKLPMAQIEVIAKVGDEEKKLVFKPVMSATLGNNATHSSEYETTADWLKDTREFTARIVYLDFPGGVTHNKPFQFPEKN